MKPQDLKNSADLAKLFDLPDLKEIEKIIQNEEKRNQAEVEDRAKSTKIFFDVYFREVISLLTYNQLLALVKRSTTDAIIQFQRGVFVGLCLVKEWFEDQSLIAEGKQPEKSVPEAPVGTIGKL